MAQVGSLYTSLTLESASFISGLKKATEETQRSAASIEANLNRVVSAGRAFAAALVGSELAGIAQRALDYASSLGETAQQLGVTTRDLQVYRFVAGQVGVEQSEMDKGLQRLTRTLGEVADGAKKPTAALRDLGLSSAEITQLATGTAGEALPRLIEAFSKIENPAQRARIEVALFGKTGQQLDTLLAGGKDQVNQLTDEIVRFNGVLSPEQIKKADDAADAMARVTTLLENNIASIVADNADAILGLAQSFENLIGQIRPAVQWLDRLDNRRQRFFAYATSKISGWDGVRSDARQRVSDLDASYRDLTYKQIADNIWGGSLPREYQESAGRGSVEDGGTGKGRSKSRKAQVDEVTKALQDLERYARNAASTLDDVVRVNPDKATADRAKSFYDWIGVDPDQLSKEVAKIEAARDQAFSAEQDQREQASRMEADRIRTLASLYQDAFRGGTKAIWTDFKDIGISVIASLLAQFTLARLSGKGFDFGGSLASVLGSVLPGFADGGSFTVGGVGGIDRNLVAFRATRGERVTIDKDGDGARGGTGGISLVVNAPGATAETVTMIRRELANAAPVIIQAAQASTMRALQRGRI